MDTMSNYDISQLLERLDSMEQSQREFQKKIYAALLGEVDGNATGLIPEHRQCRAELTRWRDDLDELRRKVVMLEGYKRQMIAYGGGVIGVLVLGWEVARAVWLK